MLRNTLGSLAASAIVVFCMSGGAVFGDPDYGDAPSSYLDASHADGSLEWLGFSWDDTEGGTQYSADADADNLNGVNDEDGVTLVWDSVAGSWAVDVSVSVFDRNHAPLGVARYGPQDPFTGLGGGYLYLRGWWDANENGVFSVAPDFYPGSGGEIVVSETFDPTTWTSNGKTVRYPLHSDYVPRGEGDFFRFRLSYGAAGEGSLLLPSGPHAFGEVEDFKLTPEPTSMALLGFGLAALARKRRRKNKK